MTRVVRLVALIVLAVCLPLQSVGAVTMPFCAAGDATSMDVAGMDHSMPMDHAGHDMDHHPDGASDQHEGMDCNQCGLCHLACASALPSSMPVLSDVLQPVYQATRAVSVTSFLPDPVRKPPRGALH